MPESSDFDDPYYTPMAPRGPLSRGDGMALVPPHEVFEVMREAGFLPTGVPRLRGFTYVINADRPPRRRRPPDG